MATSSITEDIADAFHFYDNKGDKKISASQIGNCLRSLNLTPTVAVIEQMTQQWKGNPEARVSVEEFTPIYLNVKKMGGHEPSVEQFQNLMSHYDREGNGIIMMSDLRLMLQNTGEKIPAQDVDYMLSCIEVTEGKVHFNDFIKLIMSK